MAESPPTNATRQPARKKWLRRIGTGIVGILVWLAGEFFSTPVNEASDNLVQRAKEYVFGRDNPIELQPICDALKQGRIVAPPAERDAAHHYRCELSSRRITEKQIARRCATQ